VFENGSLKLNAIGLCDIEVSEPVVVESYQQHAGTGSFILIDKMTNATVAAGMVVHALESDGERNLRFYTKAERKLNLFIRENYPEWHCKSV